MIFPKELKTNIGQYVAFLKNSYNTSSFPFQDICLDAGIELIENSYLHHAFRFNDNKRGILYDPTLRSTPLRYYVTKKISHHLLLHFERETPICLAEREAEYFAATAIDLPFLVIDAPPWTSLLFSSNKVKRMLASHYSRPDQPLLL